MQMKRYGVRFYFVEKNIDIVRVIAMLEHGHCKTFSNAKMLPFENKSLIELNYINSEITITITLIHRPQTQR